MSEQAVANLGARTHGFLRPDDYQRMSLAGRSDRYPVGKWRRSSASKAANCEEQGRGQIRQR